MRDARWEELRPATCPCCGEPTTKLWDSYHPALPPSRMWSLQGCPGLAEMLRLQEKDRQWLIDHPDEPSRLRPASLAEQLRHFLCSGKPVTHVKAYRATFVDYRGNKRIEGWSALWSYT